jgi:hypothetical protein
MYRDAFNVADKYGKDTFLAIQYLGTDRLSRMFALKGRFDALCARFRFTPHDLSDRIMQAVSALFERFQWDRDCKSPTRNVPTSAICFARSSGIDPVSDRSSDSRLIPLSKISYYDSTPFRSDARP